MAGALAALEARAIFSAGARLAVATAEEAGTSLRTVLRATPLHAAVFARVLQVAAARASLADAVTRALVRARHRRGAVFSAEALLTKAAAAEADAAQGAVAGAAGGFRAVGAAPALRAQTLAEPARAMAGAVARTARDGLQARLAPKPILTDAPPLRADASVVAAVRTTRRERAVGASEAWEAPAGAVHAAASGRTVGVAAVVGARQPLLASHSCEAGVAEALGAHARAAAAAGAALGIAHARL